MLLILILNTGFLSSDLQFSTQVKGFPFLLCVVSYGMDRVIYFVSARLRIMGNDWGMIFSCGGSVMATHHQGT